MLTCRADGNPKPRVIWSVNGVPIESTFRDYLKAGISKWADKCIYLSCDSFIDSPADPSRKIEDDVIILSDVQVGSSAVYQCNVSNEYGYLLANAFVSVLG